MICWRHGEDCGFIDNVSENRLINSDFRTWITTLSRNKCAPQWKLSALKVGRRKWHVLWIYSTMDMQIDPLYKWMLGKNAAHMNVFGTAYFFNRQAIRSACLNVFIHLVGVSSGGVYLTTPKLNFVHESVEDNTTVTCLCGGTYPSTKWKSHLRIKAHVNWMNECVELLMD